MSRGLQRQTFRNIWILSMILLAVLAFAFYNYALTQKERATNQQMQLGSLQTELENASRRSQSLDKLDQLTINEKTATRLDILRHLGLEQTDYQFQVSGNQTRPNRRCIVVLAEYQLTGRFTLCRRTGFGR